MERYDEYKESGVEWIGEIPAGGSVRRIKDGYRIVPGATPRSGVEAYWGGDIPWITPADFDEMQHYVSGGSRNITKAALSFRIEPLSAWLRWRQMSYARTKGVSP